MDTNVTFYVHFNIVQYPLVLGGVTKGSNISPLTSANSTSSGVPMVMPANGSDSAVPLMLYPPGFDLSGFVIFDPVTGDWVSGAGYSVIPANSAPTEDIQPMDDSGTNSAPTAGFYRVVRDGVHFYGLTNGTVLSGTVQFPIEMALDSTDEIAGITFYDVNTSAPLLGASTGRAGSQWVLDWNTSKSFNGDYNIYAEVDFVSDIPVTNVPVMVTVSNVISFPNYFSQVFGNQMWIYAETIPNAAYQLDIYDENTNYLGSFSDYADSGGYISFLWDLTDGNGNTYDSTNFYGVFTVDTSSLSGMSSNISAKSLNAGSANFQTVSLTHKTFGSKVGANGAYPNGGSSPSASANQFWVKEPRWVPNNNWVVAYGLFSSDSAVQAADENMIIGGPGGEWGGVLGTLDQYGLNGNISPGNSAQNGTVFTLQDQASRTNLLGYLADYRYENFYFFGHGNNSAIGAYNGYILTLDQIADALLNVPLSYQIIHAAYHPYRFVLLDGCDTGAGNLCEGFAVPAMTVSTNFFATAGVESRSFVGFKSWKADNISSSNWENYSAMTGWFLADWLSGVLNVQTCVYNAQNDVHISGQKMDTSAVIYGAYDMNSRTITRP